MRILLVQQTAQKSIEDLLHTILRQMYGELAYDLLTRDLNNVNDYLYNTTNTQGEI